MPPNSSGIAERADADLVRLSRIARGSRSSGFITHSRCQFWRMNGVTKSFTKARQLSRASRCSSESP